MPGFDVLDPNLEVMQRCFLEASAGTGKTFAIETLFVRLLLEEKGPLIEEILVVTFTKAATLELKSRIRKKIEETIALETTSIPAKKRARRALASFDQARIYTIHSFCYRSLEENPVVGGLPMAQKEECVGPETIRRIVKDYLRTSQDLHPGQWEIMLKAHGGDFADVVAEVARISEKRLPIETGRAFEQIFDDFLKVMDQIKCDQKEAYDALEFAAHSYQKMCDRQKNLKKEVREGLYAFSKLFETEMKFPFQSPLLLMKRENLLQKGLISKWRHWERVEREVIPLIEEASAYENIFSLVAEGARKKIEEVREKEELYFYEDLLLSMEKRVQDPLFASLVRLRYKAVFIDEFQDTDRLQWEIFHTLFAKEKFSGALYLIGDPKQSIYRFRHADLYTFEKAKKSFSQIFSLNVNYRSNPDLVAGLNALFTTIDDFLYLPKTKEGKKCPEIYPQPGRRCADWADGRKALHFVVGSEANFFPFIIEEIKRLHLEQKIPLNRFGVLVKDRFQGASFCEFAKKHGLPVSPKKSRSLLESEAFESLSDLLSSLNDPQDDSWMGKVLAGPIFGWNASQIMARDGKILIDFFRYKRILEEKGHLSCLNEIFAGRCDVHLNLQFYSDLLQLAELISIEGISLEKLKMMGAESEMLQARAIDCATGVQVMTIHVSKGLEFEVVFPIGLVKGTKETKGLVVDSEKRVLTLREDAFQAHLEELEAEKMRLFYVAATRARERLYLPVIAEEKKSSSPMMVFLDKLLQGKRLSTFLEEHPKISFSDTTTQKYCLKAQHPQLIAPEPLRLEFSSPQIHSFSSLAVQSELDPFQGESHLPRGKKFGSFIHKLFENPADAPLLIDNSPYLEWKEAILEMMQSALHLPLGDFCLQDVDSSKMYREMEFLYPTHGGNYLIGFIDLVFEHCGKIYIIDWKTNYLESYDTASLESVMRAHDYHLQAKIYAESIMRYMKLLNTELEFGGVFYIFVRGPALYKTYSGKG